MNMRNIVAGALLMGSLLLPSATVFAKGEPQPGDDHGRHRGGRTTLTVACQQAELRDDRGGRPNTCLISPKTPPAQRGQVKPSDDHGNHGGGHR